MSTTNNDRITCPGCYGSGVQTGNDGITITCPVCGGSGWKYRDSGVHVTY